MNFQLHVLTSLLRVSGIAPRHTRATALLPAGASLSPGSGISVCLAPYFSKELRESC